MVQILTKKRIDLSGFWINVKGEKSETSPTIFTDVDVEYVVKGKNVPEKAVKSALELTEKNCSVRAMIKKPTTTITVRCRQDCRRTREQKMVKPSPLCVPSAGGRRNR